MKITVESTTKIVQLNGVEARVWEGSTESGIPIHVFITRIASHLDNDNSQFEQELKECKIPSSDVQAYAYRLLID